VVKIRLKEMLEEKKISQGKLSRMSDVSMNTIQMLYHNPNQDVLLSTLVKIAKALEVNLWDLVIVEDEDD
jgi:DNA-binding Xre family transcriptional regulator